MSFAHIDVERLHDRLCHVPVDGVEDSYGTIMQGVVQVEQPDALLLRVALLRRGCDTAAGTMRCCGRKQSPARCGRHDIHWDKPLGRADHGSDTTIGQDLEKQAMRDAAVDNVYR